MVKKAVEKLGIVPRLQLAVQVERVNATGKKVTVVEGTGPHTVTFLEEPKSVMGNDINGREQQQFHFPVEENGIKKMYIVPLKNKEGQGNYILAKLLEVEVGDKAILEVKRKGAKNYTSIVKLGHGAEVESDDEGELSAEEMDAILKAEEAKANQDAGDEPPF